MTSVTVIQCLTAALAVLLLIEAWTRRDELTDHGWSDIDDHHFFEFRPELIVAWDDEAVADHLRPCARPVPADVRRWRRAQLRATRARTR